MPPLSLLSITVCSLSPNNGSSSTGAELVEDQQHLRYLESRFDGVYEEYVGGAEYTVDCYVDRTGSARAAVPRRRLATRSGEISKGLTAHHPKNEELCRGVVEALPGARGPITVQAIDGPEGPKIIEINPRLGGGYPLSHRAGVDFLSAGMWEADGRPPDCSFFEWRSQVLMLRYDAAVFADEYHLPESVMKPGQTGCCVFDMDDTLYLERSYAASGFEHVSQFRDERSASEHSSISGASSRRVHEETHST